MTERWQEAGFGLYIHWPYCAAKCPYCDFNSHVARSIDEERWIRAYSSEIERLKSELPGRILRSIFFGGGTPSLMSPNLVGAVLDSVGHAWTAANDIEITLEANPTSVEATRFRGYRAAGVNRISLGLQALEDGALRQLGRQHSTDEGLAALGVAKSFFDRVSFDLIYARQNQGYSAWQAELRRALDHAAGHISLYQLTIEDGTVFGRRYAEGKLPGLPDDDLGADLYELTQEMCDQAGLPAYEISNHAAPGQESRHNLIYWRGGDYAGVGPGAHGRLTLADTRYATETPLSPDSWLASVEQLGSGEMQRQAIDASDDLAERLMMGLREVGGVPRAVFPKKLNIKISNLVETGMLEQRHDSVALTAAGRPLLNAVLRELLA
ncbi:MAG: radical SAM family heme chaperone HemW [Pseudomonadota bacterium]